MIGKSYANPLARLNILRALFVAVVGLLPAKAHAQCTINMSGADQQPIDGFGFCTAWCPSIRDVQAQILYGTDTGQLGFSLLRCRMDDDGAYFHAVEDQRANAAIAHSYGAKVMGTQWAVPSQWAEPTGIGGGGRLIPSYSSDFAKYLKQTAETIGLDYVSFQNEPDLCNWNPSDIYNFVKGYGDSLGKPVIMPESYNFNDSYSDPVLDDPAALDKFSILGGHLYGDGLRAHTNALARGKRVWQTEHFIVGKDENGKKTIGDHNTAMEVAQEVSDCMNAQMSAYIWWWIAATSEDSFMQGKTVDKRGYMLGQFSRYIRPGSTRVSADYQPQSGVSVTAYRVNGGCSIVVLNKNTSPVSQGFNIQNGTATKLQGYQTTISQNMADIGSFDVSGGNFTATLPPQSVTTFVQSTMPDIVHQPEDVNVFPGGSAKFKVTAAGIQMTYQWYFNETTALAGATSPVLTLTGVQASQAGNYSVVVRNETGSVTSSVVRLAVSPLVWSPPVTISSVEDISTDGMLLYAYNSSGNNATVNGVTFAGVDSISTWGNGVTLSGFDGSLTSVYAGGSVAPWSSLSPNYQQILQGGAFTWGTGIGTVTLYNLVAGRQYQVQVWVNDSRGGGSAARTEMVTGANTSTLAYNSNKIVDGVGQYTIGAFTATGTTQSFTMSGGSNSTQINAIQVRDVTKMISWGTPMTITGPADISTMGTLCYAYNGSGDDTTVNGVTFTGVNSVTKWGTGVTLLGWSAWTPLDYQGGQSIWSAQNSDWVELPAGYKAMLRGGVYSWEGTSTVRLDDLVVGHVYQVQIWVNDSGGGSVRTATVSSANSVTLALNNLQAIDALGQFVTGTFTANATTQAFTIDGGANRPQINAIQVRDVGGNVTWDSPKAISGAGDVSIGGTLVYAYSNSGNSATVNGVNFTGVDSATNWGTDVTLSAMTNSNTSVYAGSAYPWNSLSPSYQTILRGGAYNDGGAATVTMNNLVCGHQYQIQIWVNDSRVSTRTETLTSASGNTVKLSYNSTQDPSGLGQHVIGNFTAISTTQSFSTSSVSSSQINAIQVRDVSANITWDQPETISGASDVSTAGTLLYAYNNSGNSATVNGVNFSGTNSPTRWGTEVTLSSMYGSTTSAYTGAADPWNSLPTSYQTILRGGAYNDGGAATVTMNNLVFGQQYQIQLWVNDGRGSNRTETLTSVSGNTVNLFYGGSQTTSGVGQYAIGNFIAKSATQSFTVNSASSSQINAIQVRAIRGNIAWNSPENISGASDVLTNGTLMYAYNNSGISASVKGVSFTGVNSASTWGTGVTLSEMNGSTTSAYKGETYPWSSLPTSYQTVLQGGAYNFGGAATVTMNNLVSGNQYQVQFWVNDSRGSNRTETLTNANSDTIILSHASTQAASGVGQYVVGNFTALGNAQSFTIDSASSSQINAIQVRDITQSSYGSWVGKRLPRLTPDYNDAPTADPDGDGISNLMEFALGGEPMVFSRSELPVLAKSADVLLFQYDRNNSSMSPATTQVVEYGNDLVGWTPIPIPTDSSGVVSIRHENTYDRVSVAIPTNDSKVFVRLKVID